MSTRVIFGVFLSVMALVAPCVIYADEYDTITKQIEDTRRELELSVSATTTNEKQLGALKARIQQIRIDVGKLEAIVAQKRREVAAGDAALAHKQKILESQVYAQYKLLGSVRQDSVITLLTDTLAHVRASYQHGRGLVDRNQQQIIQIALQVKNIEHAQNQLESEQAKLATFKQELGRQGDFLAGEILSARDYQTDLSKKIGELSSKQKAIIDARSSQFTASASDDNATDDPHADRDFDPGFRPAFALFSVGAFTHRQGMSQYGAKGRADAGANFRDILKAYFPSSNLEEKGEIGGNIKVAGSGELPFESTYLYGIAEMPSSWSPEALKAQAILARTYALRYTGGLDREICATESCQVYSSSKSSNVPDRWREAVDQTRGMVLKDGGDYAKAFYSSTTGGYLTSSGWDTTDSSGSDFLNTAWEKKARSPWFYKAWYRANYSNSSASCGRAHPWLSESEMADILNAWQVRKSGNGEEVDRIVPVTINECNVGGSGGNPYSLDEMARVADRYGGRFSSVSDASYAFSTDGFTSSVNFSTNRGSISISGSEFKQIFNLRAPGYISIKNALFAIEKK